MKAHALVPAFALAAALVASPLAEGGNRHRSDRGHRPPAHGYYNHRPSHGHDGYRPSRGFYSYGSRYGYGSRYRPRRPYYRSRRYYAPPPVYYGYGYGGYGYGGYDAYDYGYCPPLPRHRTRRPRVRVWLGF